MDPITLSLLLILVGLILIGLEPFVPGTFISVIGAFVLVMGVLSYFYPDTLFSPVAIVIALLLSSGVALGLIYLYKKIGTQNPEVMVASSLVGRTGIVRKKVIPHSIEGKVEIENTTWSATADHEIPEGSLVEVVSSEGVHVVVKEKKEKKSKTER